MTNKAINTLVLATVDSITKFKNKLAYYLAIFAMVFGSTFGTLNSAYAADGGTVALVEGGQDDIDETATDDGGDAFAQSNVTISGSATITLGADLIIDAITGVNEDGDTADILTLAGGNRLTVEEAVAAADGDNALSFILTGSGTVMDLEATAAGTYNLADGTTLELGKDGDTDFDGVVAASAAGKGTFLVTGNTQDVDGTIGQGANKHLELVNITGDTTEFAGKVNALSMTISGTGSNFAAAVGVDAITLESTALATTFTAVVTDEAEAATGSISIADGGSNVVITLDGAVTYDTDISSVTDSEGEIKVTGAATLSGDIGTSATVRLATLNIDENTSVSGTVNVDAITLKAAKTLTAAGDTKTIRGAINGEAAADGGQGNLTVSNGGAAAKIQTFTGAIGQTAELDMITLTTEADFDSSVKSDGVTIAAATEGKFGGDLTLGAADLTLGDATSQATFDGTSAQTITGGAAGEEIDGTGIIQISNTSTAGVTFSTNATIDSNTVELKLAANARATTSVVSHVTKNVETLSGSVLVLDDTIADTNTIFTTTDALDEDSIHASSKIKMPSNFDNGETIKLFVDVLDADVVAITADVNSALVDTGLVNYVATTTDTDDITVTATETTDSAAASTLSVTTNEAKALRQARTAMIGTAADLDTLTEALSLENGNSTTDRTNFVDQVAPQDDMISGSTFATKAMTGSLQGIMSNRMASLRSGDAFMTGMSAGNGMSANSGFIQAFGTEAEQKNKTVGSGTQFGYDASSAGLALGFDGITDNGSVVGLSFSMSNTDVDGKGTGKSKNDIDSYTVSVYADKTTDAGYIEGSLTVGLNENNSSRIVNTAGLDRTYKGDYDSEQVSLKIGGGMPNAVGTGFVTPYGSVTATRITTDAYTETSTTAGDNLRLRVAQDDVDSIVGTVGLKYHTVLDNGGTPMISLAINNEFGDNTINSTNTYQGGGTAFTTSTDVEELSATLGLGYSFRSDNTTLELAYEADANDDDYLGHYGSIKIVSKF